MKLSFKDRDAAAASIVILLSIVVLAGGLFYLLTVPKKQAAQVAKDAIARRKQEQLNRDNKMAAEATYARAKTDLIGQLWDLKPEQVGPVSLNKISSLSSVRRLKIHSFRPQRVVTVDGIDRMPFQFTVDGSYSNVVQLAQDIEQSGQKLTVDMVQLSQSDGNSNHVTATMQISAYLRSEDATDV